VFRVSWEGHRVWKRRKRQVATAAPVDLPPEPPVLVSVIIPTFNSCELLKEALRSLEGQTLSPDRLEILVIDDGSTDGTWPFLSTQNGRRNLHAFLRPHSGMAGAGRNTGIEHAVGKYLFFHDADDYLGEDALRRLVSAAEQAGSDVVVGRSCRVGEQPPGIFTSKNVVLDADVLRDGIWRSLSPHKLIRRSLVERLQLRFPEDMKQGEDQVFIASCLFAADKITSLRDYIYYYRRLREDGLNTSRQSQTLQNKWLTTSRMAALIVANSVPGQRREDLFQRVMVGTLAPALSRPFMRASPEERNTFLTDLKREVLPHLTTGHLNSAKGPARIRLAVAQLGDADDLAHVNDVLALPARYRTVDGLVTRELGEELDTLLPATLRRAEPDER
jgi:hypothetical protein